MGWSEFQPIPNEYNDEFKSIDEKILKLIQERRSLFKGKMLFPPQETIQEWATRYEMDVPQLNWFIRSLNHPVQTSMPNELGELLNVIPIMKKTIQDGIEYLITHAMQYQNESIVNLEIRNENVNQTGNIRPKLLLEVEGEEKYHSRQRGSRGGGRQAQLNFSVSPRLPDVLSEVKFSLIPFSSPMENPPKEIILDQAVQFE